MGNPVIINSAKWRKLAASFYNDLGEFLMTLGFSVSYDPGEPHTLPKAANLWIGHSRGADRLRFAGHKGAPNPEILIITGGLPGMTEKGRPIPAINHPKDDSARRRVKRPIRKLKEARVNRYHFILTEKMKDQLRQTIALQALAARSRS